MSALEDREKERLDKELQIIRDNNHDKSNKNPASQRRVIDGETGQPTSTSDNTHNHNGAYSKAALDSSLVPVPPLDRVNPPNTSAEKTVLFSKDILRKLLRNELRSSKATKQTLRE